MKNSYFWFDYYKVPEGIGALTISEIGLKSLILPLKERKQLNEIVLNRYPNCQHYSGKQYYSGKLTELKENLFNYFCGKEINFQNLKLELDLEEFSDFERKVFFTAQAIPYGKICSYQWIAKEIGEPLACRAVGNALGKNPIPIIIPCHRVVRSNGELGGFSAGLEWKKRLLELEGLKVKDASKSKVNRPPEVG